MDINTIIIYVVSFVSIYTTVLFFLTLFEFKPYLKNPISSKLPKVTVLVPAYNEEKGISKTIESLLSMNYPKEMVEIILINDGSKDNTLQIMKEYEKNNKDRIKVIDKPNSGKANSLNYVLKYVTGELVGVLDADAFVPEDTLKKMVGYFERPKVMAVTPSIKIWDPKGILERIQYVEFLSSSYIRKIMSFLGSVPVAPGCFTIYRKSFFDEYGGWDPSTITEDIELSLRVETKHFFVENAIDANVYTKGLSNFEILKRQRIRWNRGLIDNMLKHKQLFHPRFGNLAVFILPGTLLVILLTFIATLFSLSLVGFNMYRLIKQLILYDFNLFLWFEYSLDPFFFSATPSILFVLLILIVGVFVIYLSKIFSKETQKTRYSLPFFLLLYSFLFTYWWVLAFFYLVKNKKVKWGSISG